MIYFSAGIVAILFFTAVSYKIYKSLFNPVSIILWWWGGWLFVANLSITGLFLPSWRTNLLTCMFILFYTIGCFLYVGMRNIHKNKPVVNTKFLIDKTNENTKKLKKLGIFFTICLIIVIPFMLFYAYKGFNLVLTHGTSYRLVVIRTFHSAGELFPSKGIAYFFRVVIQSIIYAYLYYSICAFLITKNYKFIFISILIVILNSMVYFSRELIYLYLLIIMVVLFTSSGSLFVKNHNFIKAKAFIKKVGLILVFLLFFVSVQRAGHRKIFELIKVYVIDYHTAGFVLLDQELSDPKSILHTQYTYGLSSIGGIERVVVTLLRLIDPSIHSLVFDNREKHWEFTTVGFTDDGKEKKYNALYNIIYGLYRDFGMLYVLFGGFVIGFICSGFYVRWSIKGNIFDYLFFLILCVGLMMLSILSNGLESTPLWFSIILFYLFRKKFILKKSTINS